MTDESIEAQLHAFTESANGQLPAIEEEDLLLELSRQTIQPSWGYAQIKSTHGEVVSRRRLPIKAPNVRRIVSEIEQLAVDERGAILLASKDKRVEGVSSDEWLQTLGTIVLALRAPVVLRDTEGSIVWQAEGDPQDFRAAMLALAVLPFDGAQLQVIANQALQLNYDVQRTRETQLGNA
jgi:hypothetical protein